uniref:EF-hand domain-containing protein n=1 Tax=Haptolina brevifila TaxID=156173 RepID=A0A7S2IN49_9EUKA|eukprot:CAMPEP_0174724866 /NCGR_PEP_ID=MMETSP1094-20130205/44308_1 /TAXON_ID=156173 /ORGANISM="Chrysochromulina brevifilum, Strain UTEX LB 985" /LENGTH=335 /DNA_ID=CAMNT_0015926153 /DNA_START=20 /DNA_END=1027 /DNA_ORIENTATION=+
MPEVEKKPTQEPFEEDHTFANQIVEDHSFVVDVVSDLDLHITDTLGRYAIFIVFSYLLMGTLFFAWAEGWAFDEACYFCVITVTTVGFGDYAPTSDISKLFVSAYILVGLTLFATCLGLIVGHVHSPLEEHVKRQSRHHRHIVQAIGCFFIATFWLTIGAVTVYFMEGWSITDSIYWTIVATCTVGYGDLEIQDTMSRRVLTVYMLFAVGGVAISLGKLGALCTEIEREKDVQAFVERGISQVMLEEMDTDGNGVIDRGEFLKFVLVAMDKVDVEDVEKVLGMFDRLDPQRTGVIDVNQQRGKVVRSFSKGKNLDNVTDLSALPPMEGNLKQPLI